MRFNRFLLLLFFAYSFPTMAQPYLDLASFQLTRMATSSLYKGKDDGKLEWTWLAAGLNLPTQIGKQDMLLLSPQWERKDFTQGETSYTSTGLSLSWRHVLRDTSNALLLAAMGRYNGPTDHLLVSNNFQPAAACIVTHRRSDRLTWKAGLYYSREFFGNYWLPLVGAEYQASDRLFIWGLLPRAATIDYHCTNAIHAGISFRGLDESYRYGEEKDWFRLSQGQLKVFMDVYLRALPFVLTVEAGQTAASKFVNGYEGLGTELTSHPTENALIKIGIATRYLTNKNFTTPRRPRNL